MTNKLAIRDGRSLYLQQIQRIPVLSREREQELALRWFENRDREAGQILVLSNLRFVVKIARQYTRYGLRLADLIQEGNMGLMHALDRFDPRRGFRLISYAVWWIRAYIQSYILRSWSIVRMGTTRVQRRIMSGLQKARRKIAEMSSSTAPEKKQIAAVLDVTEEQLNETIQRMQQRDLSTEQPVRTDANMTVGDSLADESPNAEAQVISMELRQRVRDTLDEMYDDFSPRERYLLEYRLLSDSPVTLESIGREFGVTRERVRQLEERLKKKLRQHLAPAVGETESFAA